MEKRVWIFGLTAMLAGSCAPIRSPVVQSFADGKYWVLHDKIEYRIGRSSMTIVVPQGFVTDYASIPPLLRVRLDIVGRHGRAAIVHDFLYWEQSCTREQADAIMNLAMQESGVAWRDRVEIYSGLRVGGAAAWNANAQERAQGLPRIVPLPVAIPDDIDWVLYRQRLFQQGHRPEPRSTNRPAYCAAGDSLTVPSS